MAPPDPMTVPAASQGPGPIAPAVVEALDLAFVRRAGGIVYGDHRAAGVGIGTEIAQLRPYQPGDDVRRLDPSASARTGVPHVREEVPERQLTTWVVLDVSPSMAFGTAERLKSDVAAGCVSVFGRLAVRRGGRVGLLAFGGPHLRIIPPRGGRGALSTLDRAVGEGVAPDGAQGEGLDLALTRVGRVARQPGLVAVISDFSGGREWVRPMRALGARHALIALQVRDRREDSLPAAGRLVLVDPETGRHVQADTSDSRLRAAFAEAAKVEREDVATELRRMGAEHVVLYTGGSWLDSLGRRLA